MMLLSISSSMNSLSLTELAYFMLEGGCDSAGAGMIKV
jgi:hypothetical protein